MNSANSSSQETIVQHPAAKPKSTPFWRAETISQKLTLGFLVILILLAISGVVAYVELASVGKNTTTMENASMLAMSASHLERLSETSLIPINDYVLTGDPAAKANFEKTAAELNATVVNLGGKPVSPPASDASMPSPTQAGGMDMGSPTQASPMAMPSTAQTSGMPMSGVSLSADQMVLLDNFNQRWMEVQVGAEKILAIPNPTMNPDAITQLKSLEAKSESMAAYAQSIHEVQMGNVSLNRQQANMTIVNTSWFLVAAVIVAFLLGAFLSRLIGRAISQPMMQLTQISSGISMGDLDTRVDVKGGGEIGELASAVERMRTSLKMIIEQLTGEEEDLRSWTSHLASHELRRKVRSGIISVGGHKYEVGRELDGQFVIINLDYDLREILVTPPSGVPKHLPLNG